MNSLSILMPVLALISAALGGAIAWMALRTRSAVLREQVATLTQTLADVRHKLEAAGSDNTRLTAQVAGLESTLQGERESGEEKLRLLKSASAELREAFQALAADALSNNNESFLHLAKERLEKYQSEAKGDLEARQKAVENLVTPIKGSLADVDKQIREIEKERKQDYGALTDQVRSLLETQEQLRGETGNLVKALRAPQVRGRWGEIQLRRVVEIAGMVSYCDFVEQVSAYTSDGRLRPDMIVKLPAGKNIVVDAKTPLQSYLDAVETSDETVRKAKLLDHARQVRAHMAALGSKSYAAEFQPALDFVVMFLPGESFFSAALEQDPSLIEYGIEQRVILASPTTLISLLKAVDYGWKQERIAENAQKISNAGNELCKRLGVFMGNFNDISKGLTGAISSYNKAVGSLEGRVMVSVRRFGDLGIENATSVPEPVPIESTPRTVALLCAEAEEPAAEKNSGEDSDH
jgi:DNA recombination protein RmuC